MKRTFISYLLTLFVSLIVGSGCGSSPKPLVFVKGGALAGPSQGFYGRYGALPAAMQPDFETMHAAVQKIITSDEFRTWLGSIDLVYDHPGKKEIKGAQLAVMYLGLRPDSPCYQRDAVCYKYKSGGGSETAVVDPSDTVSACEERSIGYLSTTMREATVTRMRSPVPEEKACAVNTFAHEWAHSINDSEGHMAFTDEDHHDHPRPLASYVIGSIAQCLYLKEVYAQPSFDVARCVQSAGYYTFEAPASCQKDWGKKFVNAALAGS